MSKFFSKTTNGFYDSAINTAMPPDAVAITDDTYASVLAAQASGQVISSDANGNPIAAVLTTAQIAAQAAITAGAEALRAGLAITSTSTGSLQGNLSLNGTYALDAASQSDINAVATYIALNGTFPQGKTTTLWKDAAGGLHQFPSVAIFKAFATAVADFVDAVEDYQNSGGTSGSLPSNQVTIP